MNHLGGISSPAYLDRLAAFQAWLEEYPGVVHVMTVADVMKRLNKSMHGDVQNWYRLPESRDLAASTQSIRTGSTTGGRTGGFATFGILRNLYPDSFAIYTGGEMLVASIIYFGDGFLSRRTPEKEAEVERLFERIEGRAEGSA